jgi:hypothetical protein
MRLHPNILREQDILPRITIPLIGQGCLLQIHQQHVTVASKVWVVFVQIRLQMPWLNQEDRIDATPCAYIMIKESFISIS